MLSIGKNSHFPTHSELYSEQLGVNWPNPDREEASMHKLLITNLINLNQWFAYYSKEEYNSERYQEVDEGVQDTTDAFFVVDAKLIILTPLDKMTIEGGFMNIFDENYETQYRLPRPPPEFFGSAPRVAVIIQFELT